MSFRIRGRGTSYYLRRSPYRPLNFFNDDVKRSLTYPSSRILFESLVALRIKHSYEEQARVYRISCEIKTPYAGEAGILLLRNGKFVIWKLKSSILS